MSDHNFASPMKDNEFMVDVCVPNNKPMKNQADEFYKVCNMGEGQNKMKMIEVWYIRSKTTVKCKKKLIGR